MKIALCSTFVPFIKGGYRHIVEWLEFALREAGHEVERIYLPEDDSPELLGRQMAAFRWIDLSAADRVICFRPQAHLIRHPHKIVWFIHHIRVFYDLWDSPYRGFVDDAKHRGIRDMLRASDTAALLEARRVFTNSHIVAERLRHFNNVASEVLYPPVLAPERFHTEGYSDEIVCICRLEDHKRQHLLVEAMRYTRSKVRLRLCGTSADPAYPALLRTLVNSANLADRITINDTWITEEEKVRHLARALAVAYIPVDEDSYGYPILEGAHARKAALTLDDSGGTLEFVRDGIEGLVVSPDARSIAEAMDRLCDEIELARTLGDAAHERISQLDISWLHVLERLLA